jgi:hypothetical protein
VRATNRCRLIDYRWAKRNVTIQFARIALEWRSHAEEPVGIADVGQISVSTPNSAGSPFHRQGRLWATAPQAVGQRE